MLLAVDIGNTNIVMALFDKDTLVKQWRVFSDERRTSDEYNAVIVSLFRDSKLNTDVVKEAVLTSVVPTLLGPFIRLLENISGKKPLVIGPSMYDKLPITLPESAVHEIGTDLICNAVEAYCRYNSACIVVDFGTALTFTAIDQNGAVQGVAIAPGLGTALKSLFSNTAQIPSVPLEAPPSSLGTNTIHSIQSGIVLGYKGLVESLIAQIKTDMVAKTGVAKDAIHVVATGGLNSVLKPITDVFEDVDKSLTLKGLKRIAELCG